MIDKDNIWVCNGKKGKIWTLDARSGTLLSEIDPVAGFTESITRMPDNTFLSTDWEEKKLYSIVIEKNKAVVKKEVSLSPAHPAGILYTGKAIYVMTWTRGLGTKFDLVVMDRDFNISRRVKIDRIQEPAHMAWDGKSIWITSWYRRLIYKVDPDAMEIIGTVRSPVHNTTGIAWDGRYFWVTGTYSDLYGIAVERN
jgi:glutamine cyclotransferase